MNSPTGSSSTSKEELDLLNFLDLTLTRMIWILVARLIFFMNTCVITQLKFLELSLKKNLFLKQKSLVFINDAEPLLSPEQAKHYRPKMAYEMMFRDFLAKLEGEPWKMI
ncbi:hypothetical protein [Coxiella burnetii]|uniref:hypothetical protein n=1 Tax=Coxiella burnetii TaxID=777 RepID=UPI0021E9A6EA|nr:hypothetical protein [Coxiella burnetii]UYK70328.1 hypothetical protein OHM78_03510 [Coxiella burnetii]